MSMLPPTEGPVAQYNVNLSISNRYNVIKYCYCTWAAENKYVLSLRLNVAAFIVVFSSVGS